MVIIETSAFDFSSSLSSRRHDGSLLPGGGSSPGLIDSLARSQVGKPKLAPSPPKSSKPGRLSQWPSDLLDTSQANILLVS